MTSWLLLSKLILRSSWLTLEAVEGRSGGRRCSNSRRRSLLTSESPIITAWLVDAADVDVAGEARHRLPVAGVGDDLGHAAVAGGVPAEDGLGRPVPLAADGAGASVTSVPCLPQVPLVRVRDDNES